MNVHYAETSSIKAYADQLFVVACWAMVEQYCGRVLIATEQELGSPANRAESPHKWHELVKRFNAVKLPLQSYANAVYEFVGCTMERAGDVLEARGMTFETSRVKS